MTVSNKEYRLAKEALAAAQAVINDYDENTPSWRCFKGYYSPLDVPILMVEDRELRIAATKAVNEVMKKARAKYLTVKAPPWKSLSLEEAKTARKRYEQECEAKRKFYKKLLERIHRMTMRKHGFTKSPHGGWIHSSVEDKTHSKENIFKYIKENT